MTHTPDHRNCDDCAYLALDAAAYNRVGVFANDNLRQQARWLLDDWRHIYARLERRRHQAQQQAALLTVGCPYCDTPAGHWCVTASGNVNDDRHGEGTAKFHAARRRALDDLEPAADVIQLRPPGDRGRASTGG